MHTKSDNGGIEKSGEPIRSCKNSQNETPAEARCDWATPLKDGLEVAWNTDAQQRLNEIEPDNDLVASGSLGFKSLIEQTLAQDPRPAHERGKDGKQGQYWGVMIGAAHVRFKVESGVVVIVAAEPH